MEKPPVHPVLPSQRALECRRKAAELRAGAKKRSAEIMAIAEEQAQALEIAAQVFESEASGKDISRLRTRAQGGNMRAMKDTQRSAMSAAKSSTPLSLAVHAAGLVSIRNLAAKVGIPESTLRSAHKGRREIEQEKCEVVESALGVGADGKPRFPATLTNWPRMIPKT